MKALTLTQPWATLVVLGLKTIETRSWRTSYRGPLLIHAAKGFPAWAREFAAEERALGRLPSPIPCGAIIGRAELLGCHHAEEIALEISGLERRYGDYSVGRWAWLLNDSQMFEEPIPMRGALGLWEYEPLP